VEPERGETFLGILKFNGLKGRRGHKLFLQTKAYGPWLKAESWTSSLQPPAPLSIFNYIRNTPKRVGSMGALREADSARPNTSRVCAGSITPSSHSRALE